MGVQLEHANITVPDLQNTIRFIRAALPEFKVRSESKHSDSYWVHIGTNDQYLALQQAVGKQEQSHRNYCDTGVSHLGFVVPSVAQLMKRLNASGFSPTEVRDRHPHRVRVYYNTADGIEWEFIEYLSENISDRNDYEYTE